jgi:hypothetical protein
MPPGAIFELRLSRSGSEWADLSDSKDVLAAREVSRLMTSRSLLRALSTMERALHQNLYHSAHRMYRAVPGAELHVGDVVGAGAGVADGLGACHLVCRRLGSVAMPRLVCCHGKQYHVARDLSHAPPSMKTWLT